MEESAYRTERCRQRVEAQVSPLTRDEDLFRPGISGLDSAIAWLSDQDQGLTVSRLASLFGTNPNHIRQLVYRGRRGSPKRPVDLWLTAPLVAPADPFAVPTEEMRRRLGVRAREEAKSLYVASKKKLLAVEEELATLSKDFWKGVPYGRGVARLRRLRVQMGRPGHHRWVRLLARLYHLIAETFLHCGRAASALGYALRSLHLYRIAYHESGWKQDLVELGDLALIASQAHLMRLEPRQAQSYLDLHEAAVERAQKTPSPDYFRQRGAVLFQNGLDGPAWDFFEESMRALESAAAAGAPFQQYEILTFGQRHENLLRPISWERAQGLVEELLDVIPAGDIRVAMNVNWAAAAGLAVDSPAAQRQALELLGRHSASVTGFGHQATAARLLLITPDLPQGIRLAWVRRVLYENVLRNR